MKDIYSTQHEDVFHFSLLGICEDPFDKISESLFCEVCQLAKHIRSSYPISKTRTNKFFVLIYSDVWEPSGILSMDVNIS